jgi:hypothetical protein
VIAGVDLPTGAIAAIGALFAPLVRARRAFGKQFPVSVKP